jgi:hypothetical protein
LEFSFLLSRFFAFHLRASPNSFDERKKEKNEPLYVSFFSCTPSVYPTHSPLFGSFSPAYNNSEEDAVLALPKFSQVYQFDTMSPKPPDSQGATSFLNQSLYLPVEDHPVNLQPMTMDDVFERLEEIVVEKKISTKHLDEVKDDLIFYMIKKLGRDACMNSLLKGRDGDFYKYKKKKKKREKKKQN